MGFLDEKLASASSALDALTGANTSQTATAGNIEYIDGEPITAPEQQNAGSTALTYGNDAVGYSSEINTEFIHFGYAHEDLGTKFAHPLYDPQTNVAPVGHAVAFRDALQREAILFHGFVSSSSTVIKEALATKGALQQAEAMVGQILGSGDGKKPDATQLDAVSKAIKSTAETVKAESIEYPKIHEAGKSFHEKRAEYRAICVSLCDFYVKPPPENPLEKMMKQGLAKIPKVGNYLNLITRYALKMSELYLAIFLKITFDHEKAIEKAAHEITLQAIKTDFAEHRTTFPVWFKKVASAENASAESVAEEDEDKGNMLKFVNDAVKDAKDKVTEQTDKVKNKLESERQKIYDFLGTSSPEQTPATSALSQIFGSLRGAMRETTTEPPPPPTVSQSIADALNAALSDVGGLPSFMRSIIVKVNDANLGFLEEVYKRLMAGGLEAEINPALVLECGRRNLSNLVTDIALEYFRRFTGLPTGVDLKVINLSGEDLLKKQVFERLSKYSDPILHIAIGELTGEMEKTRLKAAENNALTMEVMLGRLPYFAALMFRNIYFPIWNIVVEEVFGAVSPHIKSALEEVNKPLNKVKNAIDKVSDYQHRAENVVTEVGKGMTSDNYKERQAAITDAKNTESDESKQRRAERQKQEDEKQALEKFYKSNDKDADFPVVKRELKGQGVEVAAELPSVLPPLTANTASN